LKRSSIWTHPLLSPWWKWWNWFISPITGDFWDPRLKNKQWNHRFACVPHHL